MKHLIILLLFPFLSFCQNDNLVLNPSFEKAKPKSSFPPCSYASNSMSFNNATVGWWTWKGMTPDYIIWEPDDFGECHFPKPHSGNHAVGLINFLPAVDLGKYYDFHEFIAGSLRFPLEPGKAYRVEFFIQQADLTAIDHLERLYSEGHPIVPTSAGNLGFCFLYSKPRWNPRDGFKPQVLFKEPIVTQHGEWIKLSATFVPDRAFLFFIVGNFFKDENTKVSIPNNNDITAFNLAQTGFAEKKKRIAYYLIDDISVTLTEMPTAKSVISEALADKSVYVFKNVNFETGKWDLLPAALPELKALAEYLLENPALKAEIGGHTDDVGSDEDNRILSEKRAEAVYKYLIFKGVGENVLAFSGYGESQPIENNETPQGRLANRRVVCKLK